MAGTRRILGVPNKRGFSRYPDAKIFFLQTDRDPARVAALLSWHKVHAIIPASIGLQGFKKALKAVHKTAQSLQISPHTMKVHVHNIFRKTGAVSRARLVNLLSACCTKGENHEKRKS